MPDILELDLHDPEPPTHREHGTHDNLVEMIAVEHVRMVDQDLLHYLEGQLRDQLLLVLGLKEVLDHSDDLERDLMQDTTAEM